MKKIIILLLCAIGFCACYNGVNCDKPKKPKNIRPIDWSSYNDVYTTYWNYFDNEDYFKTNPTNPLHPLMVCGYVSDYDLNRGYLILIDDSLSAVKHQYKQARILVEWHSTEVLNIINSSKINNKCFIKTGQIILKIKGNDCGGYAEVQMSIFSNENIYFNN